MKQRALGSVLFLGVALLALIVAFLPLLRGDRMNMVFLGMAVVFFVLGIVVKRNAEDRP